MLAPVVAAAFEHIGKAGEIGVDIGVRIDQRMAHAGLRGEMDHVGKTVLLEQRGDAVAVGEIELDEAKRLDLASSARRASFSAGS